MQRATSSFLVSSTVQAAQYVRRCREVPRENRGEEQGGKEGRERERQQNKEGAQRKIVSLGSDVHEFLSRQKGGEEQRAKSVQKKESLNEYGFAVHLNYIHSLL